MGSNPDTATYEIRTGLVFWVGDKCPGQSPVLRRILYFVKSSDDNLEILNNFIFEHVFYLSLMEQLSMHVSRGSMTLIPCCLICIQHSEGYAASIPCLICTLSLAELSGIVDPPNFVLMFHINKSINE